MEDTTGLESYLGATSPQPLEQVVAHLLTRTDSEKSESFSRDDLLKVCVLLLNSCFFNMYTSDMMELAFGNARDLCEEFEDIDTETANAILDRLREKANGIRSRNFLSKM